MTRKIQIKMTMRYHSIELAKIRKLDNVKW